MRFLMLTADFAPRGASPAVRTVHIAKYLERAGHQVTVITYNETAQTAHSPYDASLVAKVPESVRIVRVAPGIFHRLIIGAKSRGADAGSLRRRSTGSALSSLIVPDPHLPAFRSFVRAAEEVIATWSPDVLLTFAYPFSMNLIGAWLKRRRRHMTWIADYGDPWTGGAFSELSRPGWRRVVDARLESRLLRSADAVTVTTVPTQHLYEAQFPFLAGRVHVIRMGYDEDDVRCIDSRPRLPDESGKLLMIHAGRIWDARNPFPFIEAVSYLVADDDRVRDELKIVFLGDVDADVVEAIGSSSSRDVIDVRERVPVGDSLAYMMSSDFLLLFGNRGGIQIPGKLYEYLGVGRPILYLQESPDDPAVEILDRCGGAVIIPNTAESIIPVIRKTLAGDRPHLNEGSTREFAWETITSKLIEVAERAGHVTGD